MSNTSWQIRGDYFETCNCDFLCPCITTHLTATPTQGHCDVALVFHIEQGTYGSVDLADRTFAVLAHTPSAMSDGNWTVGVITDDGANSEQQQALLAIASGQAGGPMAALAPLIGNFAGVDSKPITYQKQGNTRSVSIPGMLEQACEAATGGDASQPMYLENTPHPANPQLALAKSTGSHLHGFGIDWDSSGGNNAHFAPFSWSG
ncbi:MAG: DUF1326 domain-containing protein [Caldilineaceae bacterium]